MPFKPGDEWNGNAKGRPKGSFGTLTSLLKKKLEDVPDGKKETYAELFIKSVLHKALVDKDSTSQKLIINYVDGLPKETVDLNVTLPKPILDVIQEDNSNKEDNSTEEED